MKPSLVVKAPPPPPSNNWIAAWEAETNINTKTSKTVPTFVPMKRRKKWRGGTPFNRVPVIG